MRLGIIESVSAFRINKTDNLSVMAAYIDNSYAVLMGYSSKLNKSMDARSELEYARRNGLPMIPCIIEAGFKAEG